MATIQASASAMMKLYGHSTTLAVSEWRSSLQTCELSQLVPLLYVANEVLQTSKRNRGNKFLEAFSPVLGSALVYIVERDGSVIEKVRRTAKIWGDRRVFSLRFVGELLGMLEPYRDGGGGGKGAGAASAKPPLAVTGQTQPKSAAVVPPCASPPKVDDDRSDSSTSSESSFHSPFIGGGDPKSSVLNLDVKIDRSLLAKSAASPDGHGGAAAKRAGTKRRRSGDVSASMAVSTDAGKSSGAAENKKKKGPAIVKKTNTALASLLSSLSSLSDRHQSSSGIVAASLPLSVLTADESTINDVVGDELEDLYRQVIESGKVLSGQRRVMRSIAEDCKRLEGDAKGYVPWLMNASRADEEELAFCDGVEEKLVALKVVHAQARQEREKRLDAEAKAQALAEAEARREAEELERRKSLENAMKTEAPKPGMVWNKALREYQYLNTEENWRD